MAKKNISNVVIRDEELTPTTIGVYDNRTKNPIPLILLVIIFISIAAFMPDIQSYIGKLTGRTTSSGNSNNGNGNNNGGGNVDPGNDNENKKYDLASTTTIDTTKYSLTDIALSGSDLSFTFKNKTSNSFDLSDYFVELYSSDTTLISRAKVSNDTVGGNASKNLAIKVPTDTAKMSFVKKQVSDYPDVTLNYDDNKEATLTCTSGKKVYNYLFIDDQLSKIVHTYNLNNSEAENYAEVASSYKTKSDNLNLITGVSSSYTEQLNSFYFTMVVDLTNESLELNRINDDNLFKVKTEPKVVKFIEEAQGFSCYQK